MWYSRCRLHLLLEKNESLSTTGRGHCGEIQFEWNHVVDFYSLKLSFTLKIVQNPFLRTADGYDGRSFRRRGGEEHTFLLTSNVQNFFVFGTLNCSLASQSNKYFKFPN